MKEDNDDMIGFRLRPTEEEIINYFLKNHGFDLPAVFGIKKLNINKFEPWQLPAQSAIPEDDEWYFFSEVTKKFANGNRTERSTKTGYWKVTSRNHTIQDKSSKQVIGHKKILVFHLGSGSEAKRTSWVIHEYHSTKVSSADQKQYVLCHLKGRLDDKPENCIRSRGESSGHAASDNVAGSVAI